MVHFVTDIERNGNLPAPTSPTFSVEEKEKSSPSSYMSPEKLPDALSLTGVSYDFIFKSKWSFPCLSTSELYLFSVNNNGNECFR